MKLFKEKEATDSQIERGKGILKSLQIVINVLYSMMIFQVFLILPRPGDTVLKKETLGQVFSSNYMQLVVIVVGLILILMYWIKFNKILGNLIRSTTTHALLLVFQMVCLMIYMYFVRFDLEMDGLELALQMESIFLALAGFTGAFSWYYATKNGLTSSNIDREEERQIFYGNLSEPIASLFTLPFAVFGPLVWTISFLAIIPISYALRMVRENRAISK